jgi:hypothetical protein
MWNSKPKKRGHNCRKASRHNPKVGGGICHMGMRASVVDRIRSKRIARQAMRVRDPEDFEG